MSLRAEVPGIEYAPQGDGVVCAWDALPPVTDFLDKPMPALPETPLEQLPGYADYQRLLADRNLTPYPFQVGDAAFLANRAYAFLCNPMRTGKTLTTFLAAVLAGHRRILVLCPSISKWVWGDEASKWLGEEALVLSGLSNSRALRYCSACNFSGRAPDGTRCPACRQRNGSTYGYHIHDVHETSEPFKRDAAAGATLLRCRKHPTIHSAEPERCSECRADLRRTLMETRFTVCNFDILRGKGYRNLRGRVEKREDLPGWEGALTALDFDLVIVDESHMLRGFDTSFRKRGKMLYDRVRRICANASAVWMVTGTPIFGMVRDLYGQLDAATGGLYGDAQTFTTRYCNGFAGPHGWDAKGRSNEEELKARLATIMVAHPRSEILPHLPPKIRTVQYIENDKPIRRKASGSAAGTMAKLIDAAAPKKHDAIIDNVLPELSEGMKVYILTFRPKHAERIADKLAKKMNSREWRTRMNRVKGEIFLGQTQQGVDPRRRRQLAKSFCNHQGAAVFIATIRSMPGSVSLKGVTSVHMADFDTSPSSMEQAEDRGYEAGTPGYSIRHYVLRNSIDDDLRAVVIPKFETKDQMFKDENAANVLAAFKDDDETVEEVMRRHMAHIDEEGDDEDDDWM